jgi:hypothetical protein
MAFEAEEILDQVRAAYATCKSYRDEGVVTTTFFGSGKSTHRKPFSTRFARGEGFLFEFRARRGEDDWDQYAIWTEGSIAKNWWSLMPSRDIIGDGSLEMAIAGATGVSEGAAYTVPLLLMPEIDRYESKRSKSKAVIIEEPEANSQGLVVIERAIPESGREQLWIHPTSFLIMRIVEPRNFLRPAEPPSIKDLPPGLPKGQIAEMKKVIKQMSKRVDREPVEVESFTTYQGAFDVQVSPDEMLFTPPIGDVQ